MGRVLALYTVNTSLIPCIPSGLLSPARSDLRTEPEQSDLTTEPEHC